MAEVVIDENATQLISPFSRPVPGQSLTNDPDTPYPWDTPPEIVSVQDGIDYFIETLLQKEALVSLVQILASGAYSISEIAQIMLEKGWREGKWKSDLMLMLAEPLMVIIMAISERAEIRDYELYAGENEELENEEETQITRDLKNSMEEAAMLKGMEIPSIKKESVPVEALEKIKETPIPTKESLLANETTKSSTESLLRRN